jgi:hypothetical protein
VLRPSQLLPVGCAGTLRRASLSEICWAPPRLIIQRAVTRLTRSGGSRPELRLLRCRSSSGNSLYGQNSAGFRESARPFKGIICDDISEFESYHPSHAVVFNPVQHALSPRPFHPRQARRLLLQACLAHALGNPFGVRGILEWQPIHMIFQ